MSKIIADFSDKFKIQELKIYETEHWIWSLRPAQVTLGASILSLKRECAIFSELDIEEFNDLKKMVGVIESTLKTTFDYDIMNYLMLMMVDRQVHYHVIPRYESEIKLFEDTWIDNYWPGAPNLTGEYLDIKKLMAICSKINDNLKI